MPMDDQTAVDTPAEATVLSTVDLKKRINFL